MKSKIKPKPTPYPELNDVLLILVNNIREILNVKFIGAYLQGSFAIGGFDKHSDVDWIIVIEDELSDDEVNALQEMHERVYSLESRWAQHLEGSYFPREILRTLDQPGKKLWYLDNGARSLIKSEHCNTLVVRWTVREHGVTLAGPPPESLIDPISADALREEILDVIINWGREILTHPDKFNNHFYQTFIVLSYCRMLHDLKAGALSSKRTAAEWAKQNLDPSWSALIDKTSAGRPNPSQSIRRPADPGDFEKTLKFVAYIIKESESYMMKTSHPSGQA
jgi:predicted nucleotidyltransferase